MMEKLDKFAIKVFNWIIINTFGIMLYLIILITYPFIDSVDKSLPSFENIKDEVRELGGLKNDK